MDNSDRFRRLWLDALHAEGEAFAAACLDAGLDTPVPSCGEWDVADLIWHLTWVHDLFRTWTIRLSPVAERVARPERVADDELIDSYRAGLVSLHSVLEATDLDENVWTFANDHSVRFILRRMAHETAVHRWDAESAAGRDCPIAGELASDGIDEFLSHFVGVPADGAEAVNGLVHLHCGDVAGEWTLRPGSDGEGFDVERAHVKGDCALRGTASDLLLALWRRRTISDLDVVGDDDLAARFLAFPKVR